jgi:hypothetical protein
VVFDNTMKKQVAVPFNRENLKGGDDSVWADLLFFDGVLSILNDDPKVYIKKDYNQHIHIKRIITSLLFAQDSSKIFAAHRCNILITHSEYNDVGNCMMSACWRCVSDMIEYFRVKPFTIPQRYASIRDELLSCLETRFLSVQCMIERCVVNCVRDSVFRNFAMKVASEET